MAWNLLRDEDLKAKIVHHLTCYLHRLQRVELINLQQNEDALQAFMDYLGGSALDLDPDDMDFSKLDRIVGYADRTHFTPFDRVLDSQEWRLRFSGEFKMRENGADQLRRWILGAGEEPGVAMRRRQHQEVAP